MNLTRQRVQRVVAEYDAQGWHRTGTSVDVESGIWLANEARSLGLNTELDSFEFDRVTPIESFLEIDNERIEGIPLLDGSFTDQVGVQGSIGRVGSEAEIAVVELRPAGQSEMLDKACAAGDHKAVVGTVDSDPPGLAIRNAENFSSPFVLPLLQVSSGEHHRLVRAAAAGSMARLVARAETTKVDSHNVVVRIAGSEPGLRPLVVMTPRSGWFHCAAERGGGISSWLEIMRAFRDKKPRRDVIMIATSGHELGHLGLNSFLKTSLDLPTDAIAWLHLGASIGASQKWNSRLQTSDTELERMAAKSFRGPDFNNLDIYPSGQVFGGEAKEIHSLGGRFISIIGQHAHFHLESDRWPDAVDVELLSKYANALTSLAMDLGA